MKATPGDIYGDIPSTSHTDSSTLARTITIAAAEHQRWQVLSVTAASSGANAHALSIAFGGSNAWRTTVDTAGVTHIYFGEYGPCGDFNEALVVTLAAGTDTIQLSIVYR